ncbi:MAG: HAD-IC family P-type ATPase, partial [Chloroflexota bacterium]
MAETKTTQNQKVSHWHSLGVDKVLASLDAVTGGLSRDEARERLAKYGPNELTEKHKVKAWAIFLEQFKNILVIILLVAVGLSAALGEVADSITILAIVFFAAGLGFIQEYRAEKAMAALKRMAAPKATVIRDGEEMEVEATSLVPGDILVLHTGDQIPADARLTEAMNLKVTEASLTGESNPIDKTTEPLTEEIPIGDRRNMVYMGTAVVYGRGRAVVTATGMNTEFGKIATLLQTVKAEKTPLQINLDKMGRYIAIGALAICFALVAVGVARGNPVLEMFIWGVSLAVAAVPEALPAVVVISLSLGVRRMVKRHALIRRLPAVETLGCTTVICSDKTGTLTQDQMTVRKVFASGKSFEITGIGYEPKGSFLLDGQPYEATRDTQLEILLRIGILCNDSRLVHANNRWEIRGDPTEAALVVLAAKAGIEPEKENALHLRINEIPFSSETKMMTTVNETPQGHVAYSKGAPEVILEHSRFIEEDGHQQKLTTKQREEILASAQSMAGDGLRVLGLAYRPIP